MTETARVGHLRGIVMRAPKMTSTKMFYVNDWGLEIAREDDGAVYLNGTGSEPFLYGLKDGDSFGIEYIHFGMPDRASMQALHDQVLAKGAHVLSAPGPLDGYGGWGFEMIDPDNRCLRFSCELPMREPTPKFAYPRKVTHCVLNTPDMEGVEQWYCDVLGFRVSDYSADMMVFLRSASDVAEGVDHHCIALNRAPYASVNHVAFEMASINDFMRGIGRMKQKGQVPSWGPGRHGPGDNPFAYFVSPSGFVIEFTSEVQQVDDATHEAQVWPRDVPEKMDQWMTAGPPTPAQRAVMMGRPDPGFPPSNADDKVA